MPLLLCGSHIVCFAVAQRLPDVGGNLLCESLELFRGHLDMVAKVHVSRLVERDEMDVGMGHIYAYYGFAYLDTGADLFEGFGYGAGEEMETSIKLVIEVENIIHLFLGDAEDVSSHHGIDVEKGETVFGLSHLIARNFTCYDS